MDRNVDSGADATASAANAIPELLRVLQQALTTMPASSANSASPVAPPATFSGASEDCRGFLLQCSLQFDMQPQRFPSDRSKIAYITLLLNGHVLQWAQALWEGNGPVTHSMEDFLCHFREVFGQSTHSLSVPDQLLTLKQGDSTMADYALMFRTLSLASGWNEPALISVFRQGLTPTLQRQLALFDDTAGLEGLIQRAIRVAQRLAACLLEGSQSHSIILACHLPNPCR